MRADVPATSGVQRQQRAGAVHCYQDRRLFPWRRFFLAVLLWRLEIFLQALPVRTVSLLAQLALRRQVVRRVKGASPVSGAPVGLAAVRLTRMGGLARTGWSVLRQKRQGRRQE